MRAGCLTHGQNFDKGLIRVGVRQGVVQDTSVAVQIGGGQNAPICGDQMRRELNTYLAPGQQ